MTGLIDLDKNLFLALNHFASPGMDPVMRFLSGWIPWILFVAGFLTVAWLMNGKSDRKRFFVMLGLMAVTYALTEFASVHLFKEVFQRLRPCHEPGLAAGARVLAAG